MKEKECELLKAELDRLQQECNELRDQQKRESEPPLHLGLVISVSDDKQRAVVLTSKRTLLEVSVGHGIVDSIKPDAVVGMNRMSLNAVKISEMNGDEFKKMITKGGMSE